MSVGHIVSTISRSDIRGWFLVVALEVFAAMSASAQAEDRALSVVAFGTSLTARGGWQDALAHALRACAGRPVTVDTRARSGGSSRWGLDMAAEVAALRPDIVLVEFSANDAALNRFMPPSTSEANIRAITATLRRASPAPHVVLMAMNPIIGLRGAIRPLLDRYYDIYARVAAEEGLTFVDHRPAWRALSADELAAALPDGSHPRPDVATRIIVPALAAALVPGCQA